MHIFALRSLLFPFSHKFYRSTLAWLHFYSFYQRSYSKLLCERWYCYSRDVSPSVRPSVRHTLFYQQLYRRSSPYVTTVPVSMSSVNVSSDLPPLPFSLPDFRGHPVYRYNCHHAVKSITHDIVEFLHGFKMQTKMYDSKSCFIVYSFAHFSKLKSKTT